VQILVGRLPDVAGVYAVIRPHVDNNSADGLFWSIFRFVNANSRENLTLGGVARQFHVSPAYVAKLFQTHVGTTFLRYLHQLRVNRAAGLLLNTEWQVTEIAFTVGFESIRTFSRVFLEWKGMRLGSLENRTAIHAETICWNEWVRNELNKITEANV